MKEEKKCFLTVKDILEVTKGKLICGDENTICISFSKDTRQIEKGDTYIGIKGDSFNGNQYFRDAIEKGAIGCIIQNIEVCEEDKENYKNQFIIKVTDTILALQQMAELKRSFYDIPVVAVTGSVGKTSTKDIIASVMSQKYKVLKTPGNLNNHIGLPFTILSLKDENALIIELGMNHFGELSILTNIAKPNVAVITNVGTAHIGNLGSRENILKAKLEILEGLAPDGVVIINNDNDLLYDWNIHRTREYNVITYGIKQESQIVAKDIELFENRSTYQLECEDKIEKIMLPIGGEHFVLNSLSAIAVGKYFKIKLEDIKNGISTFELSKKRMELTWLKNDVCIINDAYNANYDSVKAAVEYLNGIPNKRKIAVLGDMLELGNYSEYFHKETGKVVAQNNIDILIAVGNLSKDIADSAAQCGMNSDQIYYLENTQMATEILKQVIKQDDVILIKASNSMKFWEIIDKLKEEGQ